MQNTDNITPNITDKILGYGCILGMAITSRFLLNFQEGYIAEIISFVILFFLFSGVSYWLRQIRKTLGLDELTFHKVFFLTIQLFIVGAIFSSFMKYAFFEYIKPVQFEQLSAMSAQVLKESQYPDAMIKQAMQYLTPANYAIFSCISNIMLGALMGLVIWPMVKREQEFRKLHKDLFPDEKNEQKNEND